ncbi:hypothetical protein EYF80_021062 [Liparis tanakae]|uniref:Uncharacterized protein n=1 Tax=Liparis tanakae TaxID=230148 RepID=A0A4Z2HSX0_9TELE|nr:hypothetical protein EYF80_021062 [Liparis tanakae]
MGSECSLRRAVTGAGNHWPADGECSQVLTRLTAGCQTALRWRKPEHDFRTGAASTPRAQVSNTKSESQIRPSASFYVAPDRFP